MTTNSVSKEQIELDRCPFCGGDAEMIRPMGERLHNKDANGKVIPPFYGPNWFRVICAAGNGCHCIGKSCPDEAGAASYWNTRTSSGGVTSGEVVKVKALEWREITSPREDGPAEPTGDWESGSIVGVYFIQLWEDHYEVTDPGGEYVLNWMGGLDEAKAAAQADFNTRILAALVPTEREAKPKTGIEVTGFYRRCSADTLGAEWAEGIGYHVHDEQARIEGQAAAAIIRGQEPQGTGSRESVADAIAWRKLPGEEHHHATLAILERALSQLQAVERERDQWKERFWKMDANFDRATTRAQTAEASLAAAREALTPSCDTKAAYSGEFSERVEIGNPLLEGNEDDEPETIMQNVPVSWTTIKEIMAAISARAALAGSNGE